MGIITTNARVLVQGMTGKEGQRATKEMVEYGTSISCGVTPGKGGLEVLGFPIFDSVKEAKQFDPTINTSILFVPPLMVLDAAIEAMNSGIATINIITENVPVKDTSILIELAKKKNATIIGPSSVGVITVGQAKLGSIGGTKKQDMFSKGNIGIISKSGGMCAETALLLTQNGIGQSTAIGIGGDKLIGTTFIDLLDLFEKDDQTKAIVIYGEIGGTYEEQIAKHIQQQKITKHIIAFISGSFAETLTKNVALGHAGAIIENGQGTAKQKKEKLKQAGVYIANYHHQIPQLVKQALQNGIQNTH
jgi:succinyl-CoA synthetase alpha subunit